MFTALFALVRPTFTGLRMRTVHPKIYEVLAEALTCSQMSLAYVQNPKVQVVDHVCQVVGRGNGNVPPMNYERGSSAEPLSIPNAYHMGGTRPCSLNLRPLPYVFALPGRLHLYRKGVANRLPFTRGKMTGGTRCTLRDIDVYTFTVPCLCV